jgi:hypothetical protein
MAGCRNTACGLEIVASGPPDEVSEVLGRLSKDEVEDIRIVFPERFQVFVRGIQPSPPKITR